MGRDHELFLHFIVDSKNSERKIGDKELPESVFS